MHISKIVPTASITLQESYFEKPSIILDWIFTDRFSWWRSNVNRILRPVIQNEIQQNEPRTQRDGIFIVFMSKILEKFCTCFKNESELQTATPKISSFHNTGLKCTIRNEIVTAPIFFTCFQFWKWIVSQNSISIFPIFKSKPYFLKEKQSGIYRLAIS